jgi:hypothetical protein
MSFFLFNMGWYWGLLIGKLQVTVANWCPHWLVYRCSIRMLVHATTGKYSNTEVPAVEMVTCIHRWAGTP